METAKPRRAALVVGAGDATGGAIARRFAREGYATVCTRREVASLDPLLQQIRADGGEAHGFGSDARVEEEVTALFEMIETEIAPLEVIVLTSART
jgi:NAD(P)-dependent dehydrogenase (short-subunit alcohol dehydrogenase family)